MRSMKAGSCSRKHITVFLEIKRQLTRNMSILHPWAIAHKKACGEMWLLLRLKANMTMHAFVQGHDMSINSINELHMNLGPQM